MWTNDMITLIEDVHGATLLFFADHCPRSSKSQCSLLALVASSCTAPGVLDQSLTGVGGWVGLHLAMKRKNLVLAFPLA